MAEQRSLIELLDRVPKATLTTKCLLAVFYLERTGHEAPTTAEVRNALKEARVPKIAKANLSDALRKAGSKLDRHKRPDRNRGWRITTDGIDFVVELTGVPFPEESQEDVSDLVELLDDVEDTQEQEYLREAVDCLRVKAYRACVVMSWQAAIHRVRGMVIEQPLNDVNAELLAIDPKARSVRRESDLDYVKESSVLLLAQRLGVFDKGEKDELGKALDLRNRCGHPSNYSAGQKKVAAFLEDIVRIVLSRSP